MQGVLNIIQSSSKSMMTFIPTCLSGDFPWSKLFQLEGEDFFDEPKQVFQAYCWVSMGADVLMGALVVIRFLALGLTGLGIFLGDLFVHILNVTVSAVFLVLLKRTDRKTWSVTWYSCITVFWLVHGIFTLWCFFWVVTAFNISIFAFLNRVIGLVSNVLYMGLEYYFVDSFRKLVKADPSSDLADTDLK